MSRMASVITPPRPQREKWVAWPPERLPTKPNTFLATTSRKSGSIIAVGWDGSDYYAFDARCFHHGADLWTDEATRGGDIEAFFRRRRAKISPARIRGRRDGALNRPR